MPAFVIPGNMWLQYMDRVYVKQHNLAPVHQLGMNLWRDHVVRRPQIQERMLAIVLDAIHRERTGEVIDRALVRAATQVHAATLPFCRPT